MDLVQLEAGIQQILQECDELDDEDSDVPDLDRSDLVSNDLGNSGGLRTPMDTPLHTPMATPAKSSIKKKTDGKRRRSTGTGAA